MAAPSRNPRPTLRDIARIVNLSTRAVSQALRDREGNVKVSEATRQRVQEVAAQLGYRQNIAARALKTGRTGLLGILSFQARDIISARLLYHAVQAAKCEGHLPVVYHADRLETRACLAACHAMIDSNVDGVILLAPSEATFPQAHLQLLLEAGIKVVAINAPWLEGVPGFMPDKREGFEGLIRHLVAEGNRSITLVSWDLPPDLPRQRYFHARSALDAFEAMKKEYPQVDFRRHPVPLGRFSERMPLLEGIHPLHVIGYVVMRELLKGGNLPDTLMLQADNWALGALRACAEAGVNVPRDLALTGFEDDPASAGGYVPITTVAYPAGKLCTLALAQLLALIRGEAQQGSSLVKTRCELVVRQSSVRRPLQGPDPATLTFR
ncbi:MAG TPA: LacI family DNA-binding transcriptional regulator [Chthoniobacteraceae bacterium]|nr:LacI family DNA-binding transcriptional regulator [Chthoniobacteraceae bacterium]